VRVIVTSSGPGLSTVSVLTAEEGSSTTAESEKSPPNPILPAMTELAWAAGAFIVLVLLMRYFLYPRLQKGTEARNELIRSGNESAEETRASVRQLQADYDAGIAAARAEAGTVIDAARKAVDEDRAAKLAETTARIDEMKRVAVAEDEEARQAASSGVEEAVADVASVLAGRALGREVRIDELRPLAADVVSGGVR
jgi:F-type H+-transporting ATPase subunit b